MDNYRCVAANCKKSNICGHYNVEKFFSDETIKEGIEIGIMLEDEIIDEDLSDICLPQYRLYVEKKEKPYQHFLSKESYTKLFNFYDNECDGFYCVYQKYYEDIIKNKSSCVECKLGEHITCTNPIHPTNVFINEVLEIFRAENKAFEDAGIEEGTVTYTCPKCGGEAIANRYSHGGRMHGLGSGCKTCGTWHT